VTKTKSKTYFNLIREDWILVYWNWQITNFAPWSSIRFCGCQSLSGDTCNCTCTCRHTCKMF